MSAFHISSLVLSDFFSTYLLDLFRFRLALTWTHVSAPSNFRDDVARAQDQYDLEGFSAYGRLACAWLGLARVGTFLAWLELGGLFFSLPIGFALAPSLGLWQRRDSRCVHLPSLTTQTVATQSKINTRHNVQMAHQVRNRSCRNERLHPELWSLVRRLYRSALSFPIPSSPSSIHFSTLPHSFLALMSGECRRVAATTFIDIGAFSPQCARH